MSVPEYIAGHRSRDIPEQKCPVCSCRLNATTAYSDPESTPDPGDVTVCIQCNTVLIFREGFKVEQPTNTEIVDMKASGTWDVLQKMIAQLNRAKGHKA